ncbi:MAG: hypothetical protein HY540_05555 [Deltaproteobacteria bacterium]|nr:hypothetical protein [Deltaproteobacteria bacterium]
MAMMVACGSSSQLSSNVSVKGERASGGTGVSNAAASPAAMNVGDLYTVDFSKNLTQSISFDGVDSNASFIFIVGSSSSMGNGTSVRLANNIDLLGDVVTKHIAGDAEDSPALSVNADEEETSQDQGDSGYGAREVFDAWLRMAEADLHEIAEPAFKGQMIQSSVTKSIGEGEVETFRILSSLTSSSSYTTVDARLRCRGDFVDVYVDVRKDDDEICFDDITVLCDMYDSVAEREQALIGDPSDVDGDGRVTALLTPQINKLGSLGGGIITGYFYAADLYGRGGSNPVSNEREIVYMLVPDPSGQYGTSISEAAACENFLPAVFPHELQHAISYNQHVFIHGGLAEEDWLNEGMSHWMETRMGFGMENYSRYDLTLSSPSTTSLVPSHSPDLLERGASFLFLQFLSEQSSDADGFIRRLVQTESRGVKNLEEAFAGSADDFDQFSEFFGRWTVAIAATDRGVTQDPRFVYKERKRNEFTGAWEGVCLICNPDDGRGTILNGVHLSTYYGNHVANIQPSAAKYYRIDTVPQDIIVKGTEGGSNFGILMRIE